MVRDAERYADEDKKRREEADALNSADAICYQAEKMLADFGDKLTEDLRKRVQDALRETRKAVNEREARLATDKAAVLEKVLKEAGVAIYSQTQPPGSGPYTETRATYSRTPSGEVRPGGSEPGGRVVDAEYKESK